MLATLVSILLLAAPADTAWGRVRGTVETEPGGAPIASAVVEISEGGHTLTDSTGSYDLPRVSAGRRTLRVHTLDHEPFEMEVYVPAGGEMTVDVQLRHRPVKLDTLSSLAPGDDAPASEAAPHARTAIMDLAAFDGPGGGLDPARPGSPSSAGGGDLLLVRGSAADLKLVLLDGAPVYTPFHTAGLIDSFEPGLLSDARLYLGGAPARYDGGVSYVMDLATRAAGRRRWSASADADMLGYRGEADGPLWRGAGLLVAGRTVQGGSIARMEGDPFPYRFSDALARLDVALWHGAALALTGFANGEGVLLDSIPWRDNALRWGNEAGSLRLRGTAFGSRAEVTAALSAFDGFLPDAQSGLVIKSHQRRVRLAVDMTRDLGTFRLGYGYAYDQEESRHQVLDRRLSGERVFTRDTVGMVGGWYLDGLWHGSREWVVRGGVRGDMYAQGAFISFSPRLAVTWLPSRRAALTLAAGRYHQLVLAQVPPAFDYGARDIADSLGIPTVPRVAAANHLTLSLDQELADGVRLGVEGFYKRFEGVPNPAQIGMYSSGMDVWVRRGEGAVSGWLGYSLAWFWARQDSASRSVELDGRQTLTAGLAAEGSAGRVELRVAYGSGLPYGSVAALTGPTDLPASASPDAVDATGRRDFLRVDAQVSRTLTPRLAGHPTRLTPYVRLLNQLDRRDGLFVRPDPAMDGNTMAQMPIVPILGLEWKL